MTELIDQWVRGKNKTYLQKEMEPERMVLNGSEKDKLFKRQVEVE